MRVCSFDIFDTIIFRTYIQPADLFFDLENEVQKLEQPLPQIELFAQKRIEAERLAITCSQNGEPNFDEIYKNLSKLTSIDQPLLDKIKEKELQLETQSYFTTPEVIKDIESIRQEYGQLWYISDMYLPSEFIKINLSTLGLFKDGDKIFVSNEIRLNKYTGGLYKYILNNTEPKITTWLHFGDNYHSDVEIPSKLGINSKLYLKGNLNLREKNLTKNTQIPPLIRSKLVGTSKLVRLQKSLVNNKHLETLWDSTINIIAPALFCFVWWCLIKASNAGIKKLYFISRDGQILNIIANILITEWNLDCEARYLYGSRQAWHNCAIQDLSSEQTLNWLLEKHNKNTIGKIFRRLGISTSDFIPILRQYGFNEEDIENILDNDSLLKIKEFFKNKLFIEQVTHNVALNNRLLFEYLSQENLFENVPWAIVDIGWSGNMKRSLETVLQINNYNQKVFAYYFGLVTAEKNTSYDNGFWNEIFQTKFPAKLISIAELFMTADHGSVMGFQRINEKIVPILNREKNKEAFEWGISTYQEAVENYTQRTASILSFNSQYFNEISEYFLNQILKFYENPTQQEATCWGSLFFSTEQTEENFICLVPKLKRWQAEKILWISKKRPIAWWVEGHNASNPKILVSLYLKISRLKKRLLNYTKVKLSCR